jgi:hypothetical protein
MSAITFRLVRGRVRNLEDAFEDILVKSNEALESYEAEDVVQEVVGAATAVKHIVSRYEKGLRPSTSAPEVACAHSTGFLLASIIRLVERAESFAAPYRRKGYTIKGLADLELHHHELRKLQSEFSQKWMLPDAQKIKKARREISEGKYRVL